MTSDYWWILADRDRVYDPMFSNPELKEVDYVVLTGNGSGQPHVPIKVREKYETGFQLVYDHLNSARECLFEFPLTHSAYGFGPYILKNPKTQ